MISEKYYNDIKQFPSQFKKGYEIFDILEKKDFPKKNNYKSIVLCGMGGSSLYGDILNNFYEEKNTSKMRIQVAQGYSLPKNSDENTIFIVASYSGNTEESLECLEEIIKKGYDYCIVTAGGKLLEKAKTLGAMYFQIPTGLQPRLSTGYFMAGVSEILAHNGLTPSLRNEFLKAAEKIDLSLDEEKSKLIAKQLKNKIPVIYSTDENWSIARVSKIKFNENAKTQSFWNFFPELNHNEMVGFTNMIMNPLFIVYKSKYTHGRNHKRIEIFTRIMKEKELPVEVVEMKGESIMEEILNTYYFADHITYYLAEEYGIDPEPVAMVEDFKKMLED